MTSRRAYDIRMGFALVAFTLDAEEASESQRVHDLIQLTMTVNPDDSWVVSVARSVLLGSRIDEPPYTITGDANASAGPLLRTLAERIVTPHETAAGR